MIVVTSSLLGSGGSGGLLDLFFQHRGVAVHEVRQSAQILGVEKMNSDLGVADSESLDSLEKFGTDDLFLLLLGLTIEVIDELIRGLDDIGVGLRER